MAKLKGTGRYTKDVHVRISEETFKKLNILADTNGVWRGTILRNIIEKYFKENPIEITEHRKD